VTQSLQVSLDPSIVAIVIEKKTVLTSKNMDIVIFSDEVDVLNGGKQMRKVSYFVCGQGYSKVCFFLLF
jgi:hypothetical protein